MAGRGNPAASRGYNNLAQIAKARSEHTRVLELLEEAERLGQRLGNPYWLKFIQAQLIEIIWMTGRWDEALRRTDQFLGESRPGSPHVMDPWVRQMRAAALIARDDEEGALDDIAKALTLARKNDEPDVCSWISETRSGSTSNSARSTVRRRSLRKCALTS
jgi:tetratricopeptide (TPR) repeat protein